MHGLWGSSTPNRHAGETPAQRRKRERAERERAERERAEVNAARANAVTQMNQQRQGRLGWQP
jgi:Holliday junction resolvase RusA-like endonuclease